MIPRRLLAAAAVTMAVATAATDCAAARLANLVCRVRFSDDDAETVNDNDTLDALLNTGEQSVRAYYSDTSYGALDWASIVTEEATYTDSHTRGYYCPQSDSNPDGYTNYILGTMRLQTMIKQLCEAVGPSLPSDVELDRDNDGEVDNLLLVVNGNSATSSSQLLWPHQNTMVWATATLQDLKVKSYLMVFDGVNGSKALNAGVICHEMMHVLGAYDLYSNGSLNPVGRWDLMSDNQTVPQGMTAYMRRTYSGTHGNWIPTISTLTAPGEYTLRPLQSDTPEDVAYIIKPDASRTEYFMVEYRRKEGWDATIPSSGLIVYRINPDVCGNLSSSSHELYIFRPGGTLTSVGDITKANFNATVRRSSFGAEGDTSYPFYSDGTRADFALTGIGTADPEGITFSLSFPSSAMAETADDAATCATYDAATRSLMLAPGTVAEVYDTGGRLVARGAAPALSLGHLSDGIYAARCTTAAGSIIAIKLHL